MAHVEMRRMGCGMQAGVDVGAALSFAVDGATAAASAFNAAVLLARRGGERAEGRRQRQPRRRLL